MAELLRGLADDPVPHRPGRREPRARKRRPNPYPLLTCHRCLDKEAPHPGKYWNTRVRKRRDAKNRGLKLAAIQAGP